MSYHIVHILTHATRLNIDRGFLVCNYPEGNEKRVPKADILALIVAARGVSFSADCLSELIKADCIILHCDQNYNPIGKTTGLNKIVHSEIFERQIERQKDFADKLWGILLRDKIENQALLLDSIPIENKLRDYIKNESLNEAGIARYYWSKYFPIFEQPPSKREHRNAFDPINKILNYGYAVMSAILHRSMIIHGLNAELGIHHKYRFRTDPLLYDLIEPLRPICDYLVLKYHLETEDKNIKQWAKYIASALLDYRVKFNTEKSVKLLYAIDIYTSSIAQSFILGGLDNLKIPKLSNINLEKRD